MIDTVIRAEGVGKKYIIGHETERGAADTLRDAMVRAGRGFARALEQTATGRAIVAGDTTEEFWALEDVSFEIKRGDVVGIIGRNGAGKSTLLKILSRITEPTEGRVEIKGRIASLLEVGTGFHPELSGRENIYLNGAILGMARAEIRRKFDQIVGFAEIDRFLDTPVKRYSSGMYVRLAFAVAAHLDPEILIVDEVLAVGDTEFQRRCLGKMQKVAGEGRTVLFVSHNLQAIERLCRRGLLMRAGRIDYDGPTSQAIERYTSAAMEWDFARRLEFATRQGDGRAQIKRLEVLDASGRLTRTLASGEPLCIRIHYFAAERIAFPNVGFALLTGAGVRVLNTLSRDSGKLPQAIEGHGAIQLEISGVALAIGAYLCNLSIVDRQGHYCDYLTEVPLLDIADSGELPQSRTYDQSHGVIFSTARWQMAALDVRSV